MHRSPYTITKAEPITGSKVLKPGWLVSWSNIIPDRIIKTIPMSPNMEKSIFRRPFDKNNANKAPTRNSQILEIVK